MLPGLALVVAAASPLRRSSEAVKFTQMSVLEDNDMKAVLREDIARRRRQIRDPLSFAENKELMENDLLLCMHDH